MSVTQRGYGIGRSLSKGDMSLNAKAAAPFPEQPLFTLTLNAVAYAASFTFSAATAKRFEIGWAIAPSSFR